jgi:hypothetical protein
MCEYFANADVYVNVVPLPGRVKGLIKAVPDGELILINEYLSEKAKAEALEHELRHLSRDDLFSDKPVEEIEKS